MKISIINVSHPTYNLATDRIEWYFQHLWQGHEITRSPRADFFALEADEAYLSAIFTWDLPALIHDTNLLMAKGIKHIEVGGPAVTAMPELVEKMTGLKPATGLDPRFEIAQGAYQATFTSRGCPRACNFCLVNKLEGRKLVEYEEFPIPVGVNPYVCDNNLLATSWGHQKLVVDKLRGVKNLDINSGFDDRIFMKDPEKYWSLYRELDIEAWRFAYDKPEQREPIKAAAEFLHKKGVNYRNILVYCLAGGPGEKPGTAVSFEESRERLQYLIDIGVSPYPQRYRPLDSLKRNYDPPGWTKGGLELLFQYYGVPFTWRSCTWAEFRNKEKKKEEYDGDMI